MAYATPSTVAGFDTGREFGPNDKPSTDQLSGYIDQTAAVLDGILRKRGYTVPVASATATSAFALLAHYNALGAICMVERSAPTSGGKDQNWCALWADAQAMLLSGDVELDAPIDTSIGLPRGASQPTALFLRDVCV